MKTVGKISLCYEKNNEIQFNKKIKSANDVFDFVIENKIYQPSTAELYEQFTVLLLDNANNIKGFYSHSHGGITQTVVDNKLVFSAALLSAACGIIIIHNHPSGNLRPSNSDIELTKILKKGGEILQIKVYDSIIISGDCKNYYSLAENGDF